VERSLEGLDSGSVSRVLVSHLSSATSNAA
jgi:hypothetical protein